MTITSNPMNIHQRPFNLPSPPPGTPPESRDQSTQAEVSQKTCATQTDFSTSHPGLSPFGYALQEGFLEHALLLCDDGFLGHIEDEGRFIKLVFNVLNEGLSDHRLDLDQAQRLLTQVMNDEDFKSRNNPHILDETKDALRSRDHTRAQLYTPHLDERHLNTPGYSWSHSLVNQAMRANMPDIAMLCLELGADINQRTSRGENLIQLACILDQLTLLPYLIEKNVNINNADTHGETAIETAVRSRKPGTVEQLLQFGAQANVPVSDDSTLVHVAVSKQTASCLQLLLQAEADPHFPNPDGIYPIEIAITNDDMQSVQALLTAGAPLNFANEMGRNLLQLANDANAYSVRQFLLAQGAHRVIRHDEESSHDSVINERFKKVLNDLQCLMKDTPKIPFYQAEPQVRAYLIERNADTALKTLDIIRDRGHTPFMHLDNLTEQAVLSLLWTFVTTPIENDPMNHLSELAEVDRNNLCENIVHQLAESWNIERNEPYCEMGRVNRLIDSLTGTYSGSEVFTQDVLKREMIDKASQLKLTFEEHSNDSSEPARLQAYIRENLRHDYVSSGIISEPLFNRIVNEWIHYIE